MDLPHAFERLKEFFDQSPLTERVATLEHRLMRMNAAEVAGLIQEENLDTELLQAAVAVRASLGRLNDLIHGLAIILLLPHILEAGEALINRPSLAAGNDPVPSLRCRDG